MIGIALIGCGNWGSKVLKAILRAPGIELSAVYDKDPKRLEQLRPIYGDSLTYADNYRQLLRDTSIDAVALTVSAKAHFKLAEQALEAGKHIFIEKPFTETLSQAEYLYKLAREKNRRVHVDHIMIYHPAVRKIKELLEKKSLGEIRYMEMRRTSSGGSRSDVSVLQDLGVHDISIIDHLTDGQEPSAVSYLGERFGLPHPSVSFVALKYKGFSAELTSSWVSPFKERRIIIGGTKKTLVFDETAASDKLMIYDTYFPDNPSIIQLDEGNALDNSLAQFCASVESGTDSPTDAGSAVRIIKILTEAKAGLICSL